MNPSMSPSSYSPEQAKEPGLEVGFASIEKNHPNQDSLLVDKNLGIFAVLDGAGGHGDGDVASSEGVEALKKIYSNNPKEDLTTAVIMASNAISQKTAEGITTAAIVKVTEISPDSKEMKIQITSVGDARVYIIGKNGEIDGKTIDNVSRNTPAENRYQASLIQEKLSEIRSIDEIPEEYLEDFNRRNGISEYLGMNNYQSPLVHDVFIRDGDTILVCSDGIHDNLTDQEIVSILASNNNAQSAADTLAKAAVARSADGTARSKPDDTTAVVLKYSDMLGSNHNLKDFLLDTTDENQVVDTQRPQPREANWYDTQEINMPSTEIIPQPFREGRLPKDELLAYSIDSMKFPVKIQIGDGELELSLSEAGGQPPKMIVSVPGKTAGEYYSGKYLMQMEPNSLDNRFVLGRNSATLQRLGVELDAAVSREHLEIGFDGKSISLLDRSTNGTVLHNS